MHYTRCIRRIRTYNKCGFLLNSKVGLILSGGGARAAYQVGVLKGINKILPSTITNPYDIISGTSAGAINGIALATFANNYRIGVRHLERIWGSFECNQVYKTDFWGVSRSLARLVRSLVIGRRYRNDVVSVLDNTPLTNLLADAIKFENIQTNIDNNHLHAITVNCSSLSTGESVSFFQGHYSINNWQRPRRKGVRSRLALRPMTAPSALPVILPAGEIHRDSCARGAVRRQGRLRPLLYFGR